MNGYNPVSYPAVSPPSGVVDLLAIGSVIQVAILVLLLFIILKSKGVTSMGIFGGSSAIAAFAAFISPMFYGSTAVLIYYFLLLFALYAPIAGFMIAKARHDNHGVVPQKTKVWLGGIAVAFILLAKGIVAASVMITIFTGLALSL